jgi:hypothetical protein
MAILDTVKLAARIKHNSLDSEITRLIAWTRSEMVRAGVPEEIANSETDNLITECAIQGVLMHIATDDKIRDAAEKSFLYQLDNLRKHIWPEPNPDSDPDGGDEP